MSFQEFLFYHKKYDNSSMKKFKKILKLDTTKAELQKNYYEYSISPQIDPSTLIKAIDKARQNCQELDITEYNKRSFDLLLEDINDILNSHQDYYQSCKLEDNVKNCNQEFSQTLIDSYNYKENIFFGEFGIIRISKILMSSLNKGNYADFYKSFGECALKCEVWEEISIVLLKKLNQNHDEWDLEEIFDLLIKLNNLNTEAIPKFYAALCIEKIYYKMPAMLSKLSSLTGELPKLANKYLFYLNKPGIIERSISVSSIRSSLLEKFQPLVKAKSNA